MLLYKVDIYNGEDYPTFGNIFELEQVDAGLKLSPKIVMAEHRLEYYERLMNHPRPIDFVIEIPDKETYDRLVAEGKQSQIVEIEKMPNGYYKQKTLGTEEKTI